MDRVHWSRLVFRPASLTSVPTRRRPAPPPFAVEWAPGPPPGLAVGGRSIDGPPVGLKGWADLGFGSGTLGVNPPAAAAALLLCCFAVLFSSCAAKRTRPPCASAFSCRAAQRANARGRRAAMTENNVQAGFRGAGVVLMIPESVISKLDVKLRTPRPVGGDLETPIPWVSRTPNNPIEAGSQSDFIKGRIARHQGSSPTSIIEAVDHFAKGARGVMHKLALLKSENQILREENALLSRRRRAKKTRLRQGGSLTLGQGQGLQADIEVNVQVKEETRRSSGRKPRAETKKRRCGVCGETGHNARTCQIEIETSKEEDSE